MTFGKTGRSYLALVTKATREGKKEKEGERKEGARGRRERGRRKGRKKKEREGGRERERIKRTFSSLK